jgi:hypothetical protein
MPGSYRYVGPEDIQAMAPELPLRVCIERAEDVRRWIKEAEPILAADRSVTATFVITTDSKLWIADRHSDHVHCARGEAVLSAGEITFTIEKDCVEIAAVTNQSTGYCPEPDSYTAVAAALGKAGLAYPDGFTSSFLFRRCPSCRAINLVKDDWFYCGVCRGPLPTERNIENEIMADNRE